MRQTLFILSLVYVLHSFAYTTEDIERLISNYSTAQTVDFMRFNNNTSNSLFTGALQLSIPIYTISDPDFTLPISLNYIADGFQPRKHSEYLDLGWSLNAGGCIVREVKGKPDEMEAFNGTHEHGFLCFARKNPRTVQQMLDINVNTTYSFCDLVSPRCNKGCTNGCYDDIDYLPDVFTFNFCGHSGSFMFDNAGNPVIIDGDMVRVDASDLGYQRKGNLTPKISKIKITTLDGYQYIFGGTLEALEYSHGCDVIDEDGVLKMDGTTVSTPAVHAWYLTEIIAPNGRRMAFEYEQGGNNNSGRCIFNESYNPYATEYLEHRESIKYQYTNCVHNKTIQCILKAIHILDKDLHIYFGNETTNAILYASEKHEGMNAYSSKYGSAESPYQLRSIYGKCGSDTLFNCQLEYDVKSNNKNNPANNYIFFSRVKIAGLGNYSMEYNTQGEFPILEMPKKDYYSYGDSDEDGYYQQGDITLGMLQKITFPTGGYQQFTYNSSRDCEYVHCYGYNFNEFADNASEDSDNPDKPKPRPYEPYMPEDILFNVLKTDILSNTPSETYRAIYMQKYRKVNGTSLQSIRSFNAKGEIIESKEYVYSNGVYYDKAVHTTDIYNRTVRLTGRPAASSRYILCSNPMGYGEIEEKISSFIDGECASKQKNVYNFNAIPRHSYDLTQNTTIRDEKGGFNIKETNVVYNYLLFFDGNISNKLGKLLSKKQYTLDNANIEESNSDIWKLVQSIEYGYEGLNGEMRPRLNVNTANSSLDDGITIFSPANGASIAKKINSQPVLLKSETTTIYDNDNSPLRTSTYYEYDELNRIIEQYDTKSNHREDVTLYHYHTPQNNIPYIVNTKTTTRQENLDIYCSSIIADEQISSYVFRAYIYNSKRFQKGKYKSQTLTITGNLKVKLQSWDYSVPMDINKVDYNLKITCKSGNTTYTYYPKNHPQICSNIVREWDNSIVDSYEINYTVNTEDIKDKLTIDVELKVTDGYHENYGYIRERENYGGDRNYNNMFSYILDGKVNAQVDLIYTEYDTVYAKYTDDDVIPKIVKNQPIKTINGYIKDGNIYVTSAIKNQFGINQNRFSPYKKYGLSSVINNFSTIDTQFVKQTILAFRPEQPLLFNKTTITDDLFSDTLTTICYQNYRLRPTQMAHYKQLPICIDWNNDYPIAKRQGEQINTFSYLPYVGVSKVTDMRGISIEYDYDAYGRLAATWRKINNNRELLNRYFYNYHNANNASNYIATITPTTDAGATALFNEKTPQTENALVNIQYYDAFGYPYQLRQVGITPNKQDFVSLTEHTKWDLPIRQWLSVPMQSKGEEEKATIKEQAKSFYNDERPFIQTEYEGATNRPLKTTSAGTEWQENAATIQYHFNTADEVRRYEVVDNQLRWQGFYAKNKLYKTEKTDEDGKQVITFTDQQGKTIMNQVANAQTYYVYDDFNRLRFVLPPHATDVLNEQQNVYSLDNTSLQQYAYCYQYDRKGNQTYKRLPSCEPTYMIYDEVGRLLYSQDGALRSQNSNYWFAMTYDEYERLTAKSIVERTDDSRLVQFLCRYFYDTHDFVTDTMLQYKNSDLPSQMGLLTGEQVYALRFDSGDTLATTSAYYYDARGNLIVNKSKNHVGGYTKTYNEYNFTGGIVKSTTTHTDTIGDAITETYRYEYDHALRPTKTYYQLNNKAEVLLCQNSYDELGRLASQKYHNGLDSAKYAYNLHNQLTQQQKFDFSEQLYYQNNPFGEGLYNGSLSAWSNDDEGYKFQYDNFNRLTVADNVTDGSNAFAEYFSYDKMGNILSLDRYDKEGELMDELAYSYVGHQLQKVEDKAGVALAYDQQEYSGSGEYARTYDAVGALTSDSSRGVVRIVNNLLALPDTIYFLDGNRIVNKYDATGRKLESQWHVKRSISTFPLSSYLPETDKTTLFDTIIKVYDKNIAYSNGDVRITNPYGYTILSAKDISTFYNVLNYRGDVAGVYKVIGSKLECVQNLNYYPSGVLWSTSVGQSVQPYKYGEKELLEISGLDMYDNLARYYEPAIGRANSIDPHCESYYSISPYAWCGNNFVNIVDPSGMDWYRTNDSTGVIWIEGSEEIEGYTNIGTTYTTDIDEYGISITYEQDEAVSITFTGIKENNWVSQINQKINCYEACVQMLQSVGVETAGKEAEVLVTGKTSNGRAGDTNADASLGFVIINGVLESGKPIIVGVDYKNGSPNFDGMTDHFIVIASKTETLNDGKVTSTTYRYLDPRTSDVTYGTSKYNQLKRANNRMVGKYLYGKENQVYNYIVTTVRRNKK